MTSIRPKSGTSSADSKKKGKGKKTQPPTSLEKKVSQPDHPEDIFPLVLTSATQELFGCRADEDVTQENPYKLLKKQDIIEDIKAKGAVSDFSPVKQIVLDYPEEEVLLVFDRDFLYGQCFFLILTPEAKEKIFSPPESKTPEEDENIVSKTPEPMQWISLGSEKEIEEESVKESREKLQFRLSRARKKFGSSAIFSDHTAYAKDNFVEFVSNEDSRFSIKLMQRDCGVQAVPSLQSSSAQTQWKFQRNNYTQYQPRELSKEDAESLLKSESLKNFCNSILPRVLHALQQEEIMNVFLDDWKALAAGDETTDWSRNISEDLVLHQAFTHTKYTKDKKVSCTHWHPSIYGVIAVALREKNAEQLDELPIFGTRSGYIVFYSFSDPSNAQLLLESPVDVCVFDFCPSDPNIIVGGCLNGQVILWDISAHVTHLLGMPSNSKTSTTSKCDHNDNKENKTPVVRYCAMSALESSHKAPITDIQWLPPTFEVTRSGLPVENKHHLSVQIVSCSPDCTVLFWDVRLPKLLNQAEPDRKQHMEQKPLINPHAVPETFKHLDRTWKPLFKVSLPKIDTKGDYAPLKFSLQNYTCNESAGEDDKEDHAPGQAPNENNSVEVISDYSQLRAPSARTHRALEDLNTKLFIGTEDGEIVYTDWKMVKDDSGRLHSSKPLFCINVHHWLVNTIQRSPFFKDIILTTGGRHFAIWREGLMDGPIIMSPSSELECTVGCWSLSRPAVFFIGKEDGSIEVWNLLENTTEPVRVNAHVTNDRITCIKPWTGSSKQHFLSVTDNLGLLRVFEIPKSLHTPSRKEISKVEKCFELEKQRLLDCLKKKECWAKEKKEMEDRHMTKEPDKPMKFLENKEEADMKEYSDHLMLEENVLKRLGSAVRA
ncbi:dynein axonemal intermediate chain 3 isoform X2 [Gouania willdenowi]|uniref:dynein axonemal intermediate chain 3 isoform X2 n=1 Tax=Gouania willdenowi TaxID=441366 RepID=UPI0010553C5A|nr:WD repeat-containing protein 63 isoform X2 [Gouania willdenowi]